jgi:uncharacterized protein (DUF427 family)
MADPLVKSPDADHPIRIDTEDRVVVVHVGNVPIARSNRALRLSESTYPTVVYIPIEDVANDVLVASDRVTYCPYKGDCNYYHIVAGATRVENAVWVYNDPFAAVLPIKRHVAFYADRVTIGFEAQR